MNVLISQWLQEQGVSQAWLQISTTVVGIIAILFIALITHYIVKNQLVFIVHQAARRSKNQVDDLFIEHKVLIRIASLAPSLVVLFLAPHFLLKAELVFQFISVAAKVAICFQVAQCMSALLNIFNSIYRASAQEKYIPLYSTIQVLKLAIYVIASILAISYIVDRSPIYLLSGLGALTAVLLLIFQDTIKGLVASIQISANRMLAPGDWVEMPNYGADGDVIEIGLNTVKVKNFDKTITTVPTYAFTSHSFKNWRDMYNSGGRRIKRALLLDVSSIRFYAPSDIEKLNDVMLIKDYLKHKKQEINLWCEAKGLNTQDAINARQLTNVGTFRAYLEAYLKSHEAVNQEMTCMVRQLPVTNAGLPLELYFFSKEQVWVRYESIQADIFDHVYAMAPVFGVRLFQHPTGFDWANNVVNRGSDK